jgi:hypothetical protein
MPTPFHFHHISLALLPLTFLNPAFRFTQTSLSSFFPIMAHF